MSKKFIQPGNVITYTNGTGALIPVDSVVVMGARIGIALTDIAIGKSGEVQVTGVFGLAKKSGDTFVQGAVAYWDATNKYLTSTTTSNTLAGYAAAAGASADTTLSIKINA